MRWEFIAIRTSDETDASLYPTIADDGSLRPLTGESAGKSLVVRGLVVYEDAGGTLSKIVGLTDIKADVVITDQRVALTCAKYDKGGGWVGFGGAGVAFSLVANGVSHARAAHRRKGKTLVGHVRHQWLCQVGFMPTRGVSSGKVRLVVVVKDGEARRRLVIELQLPRNVDARAVAKRIAESAAARVLEACSVTDPGERSRLEELVRGVEVGDPEPRHFRLIGMPRFWFVMPSTVDATALGGAATPAPVGMPGDAR